MKQILILLLAIVAVPFLLERLQGFLCSGKLFGFCAKQYLIRLACTAGTVSAAAVICFFVSGQSPLAWSTTAFRLMLLLVLMVNLLYGLIQARRTVLKNKEHPLRRELYVVCALLLITVLLETTVFNFRAIESRWFEPITGYSISGENIRMTQEEDGASHIRTSGQTIELLDINQKIQNMYLRVRTGEKGSSVTKVRIFATDEANELYYSLPLKKISSAVERTQYFRMYLSGRSEKIKIVLEDFKGGEATVDIRFNTQVPYRLSFWRIVVVFAAAAFLFLIRPKSPLYRYRLHWNLPWQKALIFGYVALQFVLLAGLTVQNGTMVNAQQNYAHHSQYQELARAMVKGKFYIDDQPAQSLQSMENPYDTKLRNQEVKAESHETYRWDTAYYEGKYYVYFGVLPVLTFYLPFYLLTGQDFQTVWGIIICEAFWVMGVALLLGMITKKYFPKTPLMVYLLLCMTFINGGGLLYIAQSPSFYCLPILMAAVLAVWALYFWLSALEGERLSKGYLFAGALCAALTAASRPQFLLVCLPAVALFWDEVFKKRTLLSKKGLGATVCLAVPFLAVAAGVMYYNAARFGSVFDFGANYNLTTNDMTKRGIVLGRIPIGLFTYLVQPPAISSQFPYLKDVSIETSYMGRTIVETFFGGIFSTNLILLFGLFLGRVRKSLQEKKLYAFSVLALVSGVIIAVADTEMAGLLQRYITDFTWLFALVASIVVMAMFEKWTSKEMRRGLLTIFVAFCVLSLLYDILLYFSPGGTPIANGNPTFYHTVSSMIQFWV